MFSCDGAHMQQEERPLVKVSVWRMLHMKKHRMIVLMILYTFLFTGSAFSQDENAQTESAVSGDAPTQGTADENQKPQNSSTENTKTENATAGSEKIEDAKTRDLINKIEELEGKLNKLTEESSARKKLEITEEEKQEQEKQVLEAVGDEYTTESQHTLSLDYSASYSYSPAEAVQTEPLAVKDVADHTLRHTIGLGYALLDNLSMSMSIPFVYRYHKMGTSEQKETTNIGDISIGLGFAPYQAKAGEVNASIGLSTWLPTGSSPYKINSDTDLSTGSGGYGFSVSGSFSKQIDPIVAFWNVGFSYAFPITDIKHYVNSTYILEKVTPGNSYSAGAGIAYALSYKVSLNLGFSYSYSKSSTYEYENLPTDTKSADSISSSMSFGFGWRVSSKTTLSFGLGYGLTGSGFGLTFRAPFSFVL